VIWAWLECKAGDALDAIKTHILQGYSGVRPTVDRHLAAACPPPAAYLDEISEIGAKLNAEGQLMRPVVKITDKYPLVTRGIPDELQAVHMDQLAAQMAGGHAGIGEIHAQYGVVLLHIRTEEQ
jgi:hypothetical protein